MNDLVERLLNPGVILGVVLGGVAYGAIFLWSMNIRDMVRLYALAVMPGIVFLSLILGIRAGQGVPVVAYQLLIVNWVIFSNAAFLAVIIRRHFHPSA